MPAGAHLQSPSTFVCSVQSETGLGAARFEKQARSSRVSTTSIGDASGPSGPAGGPEGTSAGQGRAGNSTGRSGSVDGAASGGAVGFKEGSGGSSTIASSGGSRTETARTDGSGGPTTTGSQIGRSQNAQIVRKVTPNIPDSMRSQQFAASIDATFTIHKDGSFDVEITKGSGNDQIDRIAKTALRSWKWKPAIANNQPTESTQTVHVELGVS